MSALFALALLLAPAPSAGAADRAAALKLAEPEMFAKIASGDPRAAISLLEPALRDARREGNTADVLKLSRSLGQLYMGLLMDFPRAYDHYLLARDAARESGDQKAELGVLPYLASITTMTGDVAKAAAIHADAAALAAAAGDEAAAAEHRKSRDRALNHLAVLSGDRTARRRKEGPPRPAPGDPPSDQSHAAAELLYVYGDSKAARAIYERLADQSGIGNCLFEEKDYAGALARYEARARELGAGPGDPRRWTSNRQCDALEFVGRVEEAAACQRDAWNGARKAWTRWRIDDNNSYFILGVPHIEGLARVSDPEEGFFSAERLRARGFGRALGARRAAGLPPLKKALADREAVLRKSLEEARIRREDAAFGRRRTGIKQSDLDRMALEIDAGPARELEEFAASLRRDRPDYAAAHYPRPLHAADIPLADDEVLLEYEVTEWSARVFVVKGGRVAAAYKIPAAREELERLVLSYRAFFDGVASTEDLARFDASVGRKLGDLLLGPVRGDVPKGAKVVVVPDESLALLPFEALVLESPERPLMPAGRRGPAPAGVRYAGDEYDIVYAPSAAAFAATRALKRPRRAPDALFVLADPVFGPSDPRARSLADASGLRRDVRDAVIKSMGIGGARRGAGGLKAAAVDDSAFPRLDKTALLSDALERRIFPGQGVRTLLGADATEAAVRGADLSRYRYLVFATHGLLDASIPYLREPALVLAQTGAGPRDGFLTAGEVEKLNLNADVVALTACQTGLGRAIRGEGTLGLANAFQVAGADAVLVSLWSVSEDSTTELARVFFERLERGQSPRAALRAARAEVRRQGYEHPFYWAPFVLVGG